MSKYFYTSSLVVIISLLFTITTQASNCSGYFEIVNNSNLTINTKFPPAVYLNEKIRDDRETVVIVSLHEEVSFADFKNILKELSFLRVIKMDFGLISHDVIILRLNSNSIYQQLGNIDGIKHISVDRIAKGGSDIF